MYAFYANYGIDKDVNVKEEIEDFKYKVDEETNAAKPEYVTGMIREWRKFNNLHGYFEKLYRMKGGKGEFNLQYLKLTEEDLDTLKLKLDRGEVLEPVKGSFFGEQRKMDDEDIEDVLLFIEEAKRRIAEGMQVWYYAWY